MHSKHGKNVFMVLEILDFIVEDNKTIALPDFALTPMDSQSEEFNPFFDFQIASYYFSLKRTCHCNFFFFNQIQFLCKLLL